MQYIKDKSTIGGRLKILSEEKCLTQEAASRILSIDKSSLSFINSLEGAGTPWKCSRNLQIEDLWFVA